MPWPPATRPTLPAACAAPTPAAPPPATPTDVAACAARLLRSGGKLTLCQRPDQLAAVIAALCAAGLEPKRIRLVRAAPGKAPWLFLLEAQKDRRPGLRWEPDLLVAAGVPYGPGRAAL